MMASDSKCTDDFNAFCTRTPKVYRLPNRALLGCAGDADSRDVIELLGGVSIKKLPTRAELAATKCEFAGLLVFPNGTIYFVDISPPEAAHSEWTASMLECKERFAAVGSGYQFAIGAMAAGRSAKQAVEIAARYDIQSGAPVIEHPLKPTPTAPKKAKK